MLNSGKKFSPPRDKKKYSNSCCPKKKYVNETKNHLHPYPFLLLAVPLLEFVSKCNVEYIHMLSY